MAEHESTRGEHYKQWMKMRVTQLGWPTTYEHDGLMHETPMAARGGAWVGFGGTDDENIC